MIKGICKRKHVIDSTNDTIYIDDLKEEKIWKIFGVVIFRRTLDSIYTELKTSNKIGFKN